MNTAAARLLDLVLIASHTSVNFKRPDNRKFAQLIAVPILGLQYHRHADPVPRSIAVQKFIELAID